MPELEGMYAGDELKLTKYPNLKLVVQTGFTKMRGVNMFKDVAVYANPKMSTYEIPLNASDSLTHSYLKDGREERAITSGELVRAADNLWSSHLAAGAAGNHKDSPIFFSADLEKPLGFATFLACSTHLKKLFLSGSFNATKTIKSIPRQLSNQLVCDEDLFNV